MLSPVPAPAPTPHPWNRGFTWQDHAGPFTTITDAQAEQFDRDGFFVIEDVLSADEVQRTLAEIDPQEARVDSFLQGQKDGRASIAETGAITFTTHLVKRSEHLRRLAGSPTLAGIATDLLGPDVRLYWDQAVYKKPEKPRRFPWHQDNGYTFIEPQQYLTIWLALTDATPDNGCPQVATGLHRLGTLAHRYVEPLGFECLEQPDDVAVAPVRAGGAVVFSSLTPHLTGPNTTDAVRKAYILQYAPDGAAIQVGDPASGPPTGTTTCDDPDRQFLVTRGGTRA
jgi:ectoine hydroxylase-related dioxygenase (phytanoyl-CoA dioxygenase family)